MSGRLLVVLADGFEEAEAIIPVDVLKRLGFDVVIAGLTEIAVRGAHDVVIQADCLLADVETADCAALILPGGMPGSANLRDSELVMEKIRESNSEGKIVAAICAAPIALGRAGVLQGKKVTCYPGFEGQLTGAEYTAAKTEVDGNIVTGKGPGAAFEFAAAIAGAMGKSVEAAELFQGMFVC